MRVGRVVGMGGAVEEEVGAGVGFCSIKLYRSNNLRLNYCKSESNLLVVMYYHLSCYGNVTLLLCGRGLGAGGLGSGVGRRWGGGGGGGSLSIMSAVVDPLDTS